MLEQLEMAGLNVSSYISSPKCSKIGRSLAAEDRSDVRNEEAGTVVF
jgi:hypothetical protein